MHFENMVFHHLKVEIMSLFKSKKIIKKETQMGSFRELFWHIKKFPIDYKQIKIKWTRRRNKEKKYKEKILKN